MQNARQRHNAEAEGSDSKTKGREHVKQEGVCDYAAAHGHGQWAVGVSS